jgi:hypothetical protein
VLGDLNWQALRDVLGVPKTGSVIEAVNRLLEENARLRDEWAAEERRAWDQYAVKGPGIADRLLEERRFRFPPPEEAPNA